MIGVADAPRAIELARIVADNRIRPADGSYVEVIAASMAEIGLRQPIVVRPNIEQPGSYLLVAGLHRLIGAKINGWAEIDAIVTNLDDDEARLVEIDENLMRRELGALDRALFLAERKRVWEVLHPQVAKGGDQKAKQKQRSDQNDILSFSSEAAEKTGLTKRTIQRAIALVAGLSPDTIATIRGTYLEDHAADLAALAELPEAQRNDVANRIARGEIKRIADRNPRPTLSADETEFQKLLERWERAGSKARKRFLKTARLIERSKATAAELAAFDAADLDEAA